MTGRSLTRRPFVYVRHGETDWNRERRCVGQADRPLTARGRAQAEAVRSVFAVMAPATMFHSPLLRAAETARILARGTQLTLVSEAGLMEARLGDKEGCREDDPQDDFIARWFGGGAIPNAEAYTDFRARVVAAVNRCLAFEQETVFVAHSAVYAALADAAGHGIGDIDHCRPHRFSPAARGWTIEPWL